MQIVMPITRSRAAVLHRSIAIPHSNAVSPTNTEKIKTTARLRAAKCVVRRLHTYRAHTDVAARFAFAQHSKADTFRRNIYRYGIYILPVSPITPQLGLVFVTR